MSSVPGAKRPRALLRAFGIAWLGLAAACRCTVPLDDALGDLREAGFRTWTASDDVSLITPWDAAATSELHARAEADLRAVERAFDVTLARPLDLRVISLPPAEPAGDSDARPSLHGAVGHTLPDHDGLVLYSSVRPTRPLEALERTLRHELAHLAARRLGLAGPTWFDEGMALQFETARRLGDTLVFELDSELLGQARRVHALVEFAELLDWDEDGRRVAGGLDEVFLPGRPLAWSLVRFLLERDPDGPLSSRLARIRALRRDELNALEPAWRAWLDASARPVDFGRTRS